MSGGKKQLCKHECLKIISPLPPPPFTLHAHVHACARARTHTHTLTHKLQHNIRRLKLKHHNYGDGRLNSITICSFNTYHTGFTVFSHAWSISRTQFLKSSTDVLLHNVQLFPHHQITCLSKTVLQSIRSHWEWYLIGWKPALLAVSR